MIAKRITMQNALKLSLPALVLSGCISLPDTTAKLTTQQPITPAPPQKTLVIHQLQTEVITQKNVAAVIDFSNQTDRDLDYVMFKTIAFDAEGKVIPAMKSGDDHAYLRIAGPLSPEHRTGDQQWDKVWADSSVSCFRIESAELIFSDSSVEDYSTDQIELQLPTLQPAICQHDQGSLASN
ncbi:hypothetical protein XMM312_002260 [Marinobacterium sp. xm-m-312]|nr:hypothetical protein [Marinobacterium sp. xm-d-543]NRQ24541.1 hypothetical protein [Marinobacterium sp. xm-m-312]